jgi:hypothetical protein
MEVVTTERKEKWKNGMSYTTNIIVGGEKSVRFVVVKRELSQRHSWRELIGVILIRYGRLRVAADFYSVRKTDRVCTGDGGAGR